MTYIEDLDPNSPLHAAAEAYTAAWDAEYPDWEERATDPERRTNVDYSDVSDPEEGHVRRYGSDDPGRYFPGASGE